MKVYSCDSTLYQLQVKDIVGKQVITIVGSSSQDFANKEALALHILSILNGYDPSKIIVCIGATTCGIGFLYSYLKQWRYATMGIVSSKVNEIPSLLSKDMDYLFIVEDNAWGGYTKDGYLTPTSRLMVASTDVLIALPGGDVTLAEKGAIASAKKPIIDVAWNFVTHKI